MSSIINSKRYNTKPQLVYEHDPRKTKNTAISLIPMAPDKVVKPTPVVIPPRPKEEEKK